MNLEVIVLQKLLQAVDCDLVVNVQGDEPFTDKESLKKVLSVFENDPEKEIDLASLMVHITDPEEIQNPNTVKVIVDQRNFALYFSRSPIPYQRDKTVDTKYFKHKGVYAFRKEALLDFTKLPMKMLEVSEKIECIRYLEFGKKIKMVETDVQGIEIDTPEDLERAKTFLKKLIKLLYIEEIRFNLVGIANIINHFNALADPYFAVTIPFDVSLAYKKSKDNNHSFFAIYLHDCMKAINHT